MATLSLFLLVTWGYMVSANIGLSVVSTKIRWCIKTDLQFIYHYGCEYSYLSRSVHEV